MELVGPFLFLPFLIFLVMGVPIAFSLGLACVFFLLFSGTQIPPLILVTEMYAAVDSFALLALPMFVLTGELLNRLQPHGEVGRGGAAADRLDQGRACSRQHRHQHVFRRYLGLGAGRRRINRADPDSGDDPRALPSGVLGGGDRREFRGRRDYSAQHSADHRRRPAADLPSAACSRPASFPASSSACF